MKKEEYEFELPSEFKEIGAPLEDAPQQDESEVDLDEVYSDDTVENLLNNDEISSLEAGFMHGYIKEAQEGA